MLGEQSGKHHVQRCLDFATRQCQALAFAVHLGSLSSQSIKHVVHKDVESVYRARRDTKQWMTLLEHLGNVGTP